MVYVYQSNKSPLKTPSGPVKACNGIALYKATWKQENGALRKRYNHELYEIFNDSNIVNYIKVKKLAWHGT
jgi:hypothetical protein